MRNIKTFVLYAAAIFSMPALGQDEAGSGLSPLTSQPARISATKKVFISNAGGETGLLYTAFSGGPDRAYNQFYAAMRSWGRFQLVADPADSDLVFQIRYSNPWYQEREEKHRSDYSRPPEYEVWNRVVNVPEVRVNIFDTKTCTLLRVLMTYHMQDAYFLSHRDKNFDDAMAALTREAQDLLGTAPAPMPALPPGKSVAPAPVPPKISAAKKVLIRTSGDGLDQAYNEFTAAMQSWGRYELVQSPADADLIFEISPGLELLVLDPKTKFALWGVTERFGSSIFAGSRRKYIIHAAANLANYIKQVVARSDLVYGSLDGMSRP